LPKTLATLFEFTVKKNSSKIFLILTSTQTNANMNVASNACNLDVTKNGSEDD